MSHPRRFSPGRRVANPLISNDAYEALYARSVEDPIGFWEDTAQSISWIRPWSEVLRWNYERGEVRWFEGATLNVCYNCVDRHLPERREKTAIIYEGNEPGEGRSLTYGELHREVCRTANALRSLGVSRGDRVAIYMPMIPEAAIAMLACARIGAVHSVVFAGFSAEALRGRIEDSKAKLVITADEGVRGSKRVPLKETVDAALAGLSFVEHVIVFRRTGAPVTMSPPRDIFWDDIVPRMSADSAYEEMNAEDPLFILYTSGSTGKPKGALHTQAGYLLFTSYTHRIVFDYREEDIYFCTADIGWITGHSYVLYGPLANGATSVFFESVPNYPDAGRYWDVVRRHRVNVLYTAPTAIRAIAKEGRDLPLRYDLSSLRVLGTVGEPINEDAWLWYHEAVGRGECSIVDTWWQTETGGILISPLPGATETKPGSATLPLPGIQPAIVDDGGRVLDGNGVRGYLCMRFPWPGQMRTIYGDHERFIETYFKKFKGLYFSGDACIRDEDGYYWITGRVDDVLNVSGHRIGTAELEDALVQSGVVAEAAVVGVPHEITGTAIHAFCILKEDERSSQELSVRIKDAVRSAIGGFAVPQRIVCVPGLPKTRSGKIMRRILRKIAQGEIGDLGDTTTLSDPAVVDAIIRETVEPAAEV